MENEALLTYSGPLARVARPMTVSSARSLVLAGGLLFIFGATTVLPVLFGWTRLQGANKPGFTVLAGAAFVSGLALTWFSRAAPQTLNRVFAPMATIGFLIAAGNASLAVVFAGPTFPAASVFYVQVQLLAYIALRRQWAIGVTVLAMLGLAIALAVLDDPVAPVQHFFNIAAAAVATAVLIGGLAERLDDSQARVAAINRRLRRFLAPQVADAVAANEAALEPHRADIAALFVDLRGFTAFTNAVAPRQVVDILAEYYATVGAVVDAHGGTIGGFDGDGVFAFVGDPLPDSAPAATALTIAKEVAAKLDVLTQQWSSAGTPLGYGIGLAYGEATIGLVGYEGRLDYSPVGACVNLAARLCAEADGVILIDASTRDALGLAATTGRKLELKGFGEVGTFEA